MKKIISLFALSLLSIGSVSYAQGVDYSKGSTNPFYNYQYKTPQQQAREHHMDNLNYFDKSLENPLQSSKRYTGKYSKSKYKHLIENQEAMQGCWDRAAKTYKLDPWLLMAIAKVESSFNPNAVNTSNRNKTADIGLMQINDIWLPTLKKFGIHRKDLFEPCTSIFVGAWILAQNIKRFGYNLDGIGAYNSPKHVITRRKYAQKVYLAYDEITKDLYYNKKR